MKIVIDPSRGGAANYAHYQGEVRESNAVLNIVKHLSNELFEQGHDVLLTCCGFITMHDLKFRAEFVAANKADIFIGIQADYIFSPDIRGTETYCCQSSPVSRYLAETIQTLLVKALGTTDRGIKDAGLTVLQGIECPGVLVNVGYMSNPTDQRILNDSRGQREAAKAIAAGIADCADIIRQGRQADIG